jgi:hypothetical protein
MRLGGGRDSGTKKGGLTKGKTAAHSSPSNQSANQSNAHRHDDVAVAVAFIG